MGISISVSEDGTIQLPKHIIEKLNIHNKIEISETPKGILLIPKREWQEIFSHKLKMKKDDILDLSEVRIDDLWL